VSVARRINKVVHDLDHAIGRLSSARRVLVEMRTPVYQAVLGPVCSMLQDAPGIDLCWRPRDSLFSELFPLRRRTGTDDGFGARW
jgi:hypothetical protein